MARNTHSPQSKPGFCDSFCAQSKNVCKDEGGYTDIFRQQLFWCWMDLKRTIFTVPTGITEADLIEAIITNIKCGESSTWKDVMQNTSVTATALGAASEKMGKWLSSERGR